MTKTEREAYTIKALKYVLAARPLVGGTCQALRKDTARRLQREGLITHPPLSSNLGITWELTAEGFATLGLWQGIAP